WNMVHGSNPEDVLKDEEGVQVMKTLGRNMAWILKSIEAGKRAGVAQPESEKKIFTNFIR
ncbi:MAG: flavodoxin family protein, partial [Treponema sp.]|nr:flavodoxin family protein [Treponema sp.]MCH5289909.1 flavodoxin family protein [Treponema sp.]